MHVATCYYHERMQKHKVTSFGERNPEEQTNEEFSSSAKA